jgi:peptide/nickel transport system substrate-binding protein
MRQAPGWLRRWSRFLILGTVMLAVTAGVAWSQGGPKPGGTLVLLQVHPTWWNPLLESSAPFVNRIVYMGLTDYDAKGEVVPGLAEKWSVSGDKLTYTFSLRKGVKWHDGKPFTAGDVKFTFERILDPEVGSWLKGFFENVSQVDTPDDHTVIVRLRAPSPTLLYNAWHGILPRHIWEKEDFKKSAYNGTPVGTGPFKLTQWMRNDQAIFAANEDFFRGRPYLDRLVMKVVPDSSVGAVALERGEADYLSAFGIIGGAPYHLVKTLEQKPNLQVAVNETTQTQYLYMRIDKAPFDNLKVRQAIAHAINKQEVSDRVTAGYGKALDSRVPPLIGWAHEPNVPAYRYDVARANQLLDEAGVKRGPDGVRFKTKIYANPGPRLMMSELFREQLRAVGIDAEIVTQDWAAYIGGIRDRRTVEGMWTLWQATYIPDPEILLYTYSSKEIKPGGRNYVFYSSPAMDRLLEQSFTTTERGPRGTVVREIQKVAAADVAGVIPLFVQPVVEVWNRRVKGIQFIEYGGSSLTFLEKVWKE